MGSLDNVCIARTVYWSGHLSTGLLPDGPAEASGMTSSTGNGTDIHVVLTFDVDAELLWLARDPGSADKPVWLSQGSYGIREGLPRILALLTGTGIPASFFVPARNIEAHPAEIGTILEAGFAIQHHSYSHTWPENLSPDQEREEMQRAAQIITDFTGTAPTGYRSPAGEFTPHTLGLLAELGIEFSSNMFDRDSPYLLEVAGEESAIVEFPFAWALDDAPFWLYSNRLPGRSMAAPSAVLETWCREFDGLAAESGRCLVLAMHPQVIGRPSRMWVLGQFIEHALAGGGRFTTLEALCTQLRPRLVAERAGSPR
jgi:peptidoglycan/xylan/chitin deacetylase (PgdA/CDA1 family)